MTFGYTPEMLRGGPHAHVSSYRDVTGKVFDWSGTRQLLCYLAPHRRAMVEAALRNSASPVDAVVS